MSGGNQTHVVILGGGFAGVYAARYLEKRLGRRGREKVQITLVARENYLVFQPMLPEIIGGHIETLHTISPIRRLAPHAHLFTREVEVIDLAARAVTLAPGFRPRTEVLQYDHLIIAMGTILDYAKVPGSREHSLPFRYLGDALTLRNQLVRCLEEADNELDPIERQKLLTFVVAGGGFSGIECAAEVNEFLKHAARSYQNISAADLRVVVLQSGSRILPELKEDLAAFAHRILTRRGVEIRLNTRLKSVTANLAIVQAKDSQAPEKIASRTVVTTIPAGPHPLLMALPCPMEKGRLKVNEFMEVSGFAGVWAIGDCAAVPQRDGMFSPATAQHATRQAKTCAANIAAALGSGKKIPFTFTGLGTLASLGRGSAVAEIMGIKISGPLAWFLWRTIYLGKFPGLDRQVRIATDWTLDLFLPRDITEIRLSKPDAVRGEHFEAGEIILEQGEVGDKVYFIRTGNVQILKDGVSLGELGPGDVLGEIALISNHPRAATARARTPLDVVSVDREAFKQLLAHVPGVKMTMQQIMSKHLGGVSLAEKMGMTDELSGRKSP
jgi:NADH dehydrogenase